MGGRISLSTLDAATAPVFCVDVPATGPALAGSGSWAWFCEGLRLPLTRNGA
eukprot:CAMPEP_0196572458 /NCGR_PEP_ID=MMETSP1081-20130531/2511_1 /TAXON_ID=36882 /ORGANISM="Pyramimonas amylifera, Strain CCMP720" /LENGTH=51 /DNA_ID=CAMNT_0041889793 /DNA_START=699 /DNA_END=854 /DNA_ORIENTATION=-